MLLNNQAQGTVISGICHHSSCKLATACISQRSVLGLMILNILINHRAECTLSKFSGDTKQGGVADIPDEWADRNLKQFVNGECKVLYLERNNPQK